MLPFNLHTCKRANCHKLKKPFSHRPRIVQSLFPFPAFLLLNFHFRDRAASNLLVLSVCMTYLLICQLVFIKLMKAMRRRHYKPTVARPLEQKMAKGASVVPLPTQQATPTSTVIAATTTVESKVVEKKQPQKAVNLQADQIDSKKPTNEKNEIKRPSNEPSGKKRNTLNLKAPDILKKSLKLVNSLAVTMDDEKTLDLYDHGASVKKEGQQIMDPTRDKTSNKNIKSSSDGVLGSDANKKDDFFALPKR